WMAGLAAGRMTWRPPPSSSTACGHRCRAARPSLFATVRRTPGLFRSANTLALDVFLGGVADHAEMVDGTILALVAAASGMLVEVRGSRRRQGRADRLGI